MRERTVVQMALNDGGSMEHFCFSYAEEGLTLLG